MRIFGIFVRRIKMWLFRLRGGRRYSQTFCSPPLSTSFGRRKPRSPISDHLGSLFFFAIDAKPRLIVELGTRDGESTRAFLAAASMTGADLLSIDRDDCGQLDLPFSERWHFVQCDDVEFGRSGFVDWCRDRSLEPRIDLLFIDTSHWYDHTKQEIETWAPYLSDHGTLIFHDTNMGTGPFARLDGSVGFGYDNKRGVIRAIEEWVGRRYDEKSFFCDLAGGFLIMHHPHCAGLAIFKKYTSAPGRGAATNADEGANSA